MKKTIALFLAVLTLMGAFTVMAASAATSKVILVDNKYKEGEGFKKTEVVYEPKVGTLVTYTCSVSCPNLIEDGQFLLLYDNKILKVSEVSVPNIPEAVFNPDFKTPEYASTYLNDKVKMNFSRYKGVDFKEEKVLFTIKFSVIAEGEGKIELLTDPDEKIPFESNVSEGMVISDTNDKDVIRITTINQKLELSEEPSTEPETTASASVEPTATEGSTSASQNTEATEATTNAQTSSETAAPTESGATEASSQSDATASTASTDPSDTSATTPSETTVTDPSATDNTNPSDTSATNPSDTSATEPSETGATEPSETGAQATDSTTAPATEATTSATEPTDKPSATVSYDDRPSVKGAVSYFKNLKNDKDPAGTVFGNLRANSKKVSTKAIKLTWNKVSGAKSYIIMGGKCGKSYKKLKTLSKLTYTQKKLKKGTYYKFIVMAADSNNKVIDVSKVIHVTTKGGKYGNYKSVKFTNAKSSITIKKGKSFTLKAKAVKTDKKVKNHRKICFESSNTGVAKINSKGKITAKGKGTAKIFAYAQNGVYKVIKVKVK